jgi:uncharacterized protein YukE
MSEQVWNFPAIHGALATLRGHAGTMAAQHEQLVGLLGQLQAQWTGGASEQMAVEQTRLNARYGEFFAAVNDYINAVESATEGQQQQEAINQASFA